MQKPNNFRNKICIEKSHISYLYIFLIRFLLVLGKNYRRIINNELDTHAHSIKIKIFPKNHGTEVIFISDWLFRDYQDLIKHQDAIRHFFTPLRSYIDRISEFIAICRKKCDILIGIHLRKGDYKSWNNGKYFYSDSIYSDKMLQIENHFLAQNKSVLFLLCSDSKINKENFLFKNLYTGLGHLIEDLYSLAQCDYIIGPPSTYSMWASFYGNVPLLHITEPNQIVRIQDFKVING